MEQLLSGTLTSSHVTPKQWNEGRSGLLTETFVIGGGGFQTSSMVDPSCIWIRFPLNLSRVERPPVGLVWKLGGEGAALGILLVI
ncbi:hypothetical protein AVEN_182873-1 [Araneus ventricosus]|uniref:Uncharacterized protein n=1 Tax=Araneus ventricosus TaxID=182803 RepID=A0A4Y2JNH3_ARAVE|nr:hypothetical protein AVEN_182873-1 [Araneus ventricosus]